MSNIPNGIPAAAAAGGVVAALAPARAAGPPSREAEGGSFSKWLAHSRADGEAPADDAAAAPTDRDASEAPARGRTPPRKEALDKDTAPRALHHPHRAASAHGDAVGLADASTDQGGRDATAVADDAGHDRLGEATDATARPPADPVIDLTGLVAAPPAEAAQPGCELAASMAAAACATPSRPAESLRVEHGDGVELPAPAAIGGGAVRAAATAPDARRAAPSQESATRFEARVDGPLDRDVDRGAAVDDSAAARRAARGRPHLEALRPGSNPARDPSPVAATLPEASAARTAASGESAVTSGAAAAAVEALAVLRTPARRADFTAPGADTVAPAPVPGGLAHATSQAIDAPAAPAPSSSLAVPFDDPGFALALGSRLAVLARDGVHRAELQLNPADMGPISVQIALDGTRVTVDLGAAVAATRERLEASLHELAAALREAGLTLAGGGVHEHRRDRAASPPREAEGDGSRSGRSRGAAAGEAVAPAAAATRRTLRGVVDLYA